MYKLYSDRTSTGTNLGVDVGFPANFEQRFDVMRFRRGGDAQRGAVLELSHQLMVVTSVEDVEGEDVREFAGHRLVDLPAVGERQGDKTHRGRLGGRTDDVRVRAERGVFGQDAERGYLTVDELLRLAGHDRCFACGCDFVASERRLDDHRLDGPRADVEAENALRHCATPPAST